MVKILESGGTYAITGTPDGLRVVDRPKRCKHYQNGCACPGCRKKPKEAVACQCGQPMDDGSHSCVKCGHHIHVAAA